MQTSIIILYLAGDNIFIKNTLFGSNTQTKDFKQINVITLIRLQIKHQRFGKPVAVPQSLIYGLFVLRCSLVLI